MPPKSTKTEELIHDYAASVAITDIFLEGPKKDQVTTEQIARLLPKTPGLFKDCLIAIKDEKAAAIAEVEAKAEELQKEVEAFDAERKAAREKNKQVEEKNKKIEATLAELLGKVKGLAVLASQDPRFAHEEPLEDDATTDSDKSSEPAETGNHSKLAISIMDKIDKMFNLGEHSSDGHGPDMATPDEATEDDFLRLEPGNFLRTRVDLGQYLLRFDVRDSEMPASFATEFFARIFADGLRRARFDDYHRHGQKRVRVCLSGIILRGIGCKEVRLANCFCDEDSHAVLRGYCVRVEKLLDRCGPIRFLRDQDLPVVMVPLWKGAIGGE
ncbi:hypothetical protein B0I37DRAFT_348746 [Chaetomium sp. MPI-CAGE-AT-0009]|nr:hypothetical protein B0I37DRAFT_348746 [Chaetomium sp. MPI-CAGE-AT-0009]